MKRYFLTVLCLIVIAALSVPVCAAPPEIASTSITAEGLTLVYGAGFAAPGLESYVQLEPKQDKSKPVWGETELKASLGRLLAGKSQMPTAPAAKDAGWKAVQNREENILLCNTGGEAGSTPDGGLPQRGQTQSGVKVLYLRRGAETGRPFILNRPEIWGAAPRRAAPGEQVAVWGLNIGRDRPTNWHMALVNEAGSIAALLTAYSPYHDHSIRAEGRFLRLLRLPDDIPAGEYRLYCWGGFGDIGWSLEPFKLRIQPREAPGNVLNVRDFGAVGDGATDDSAAFRAAIAKAGEAGGGRINVPAGRFLISQSLILPANVGLFGLSREATVLALYPEKRLHNPDLKTPPRDPRYAPFVSMTSGCSLSDLTLDVTRGQTPACAVSPGGYFIHTQGGVGMTLRRVALLDESSRAYGEFNDTWEWTGMVVTGDTQDLVVEQCLLATSGHGITCWGSHNTGGIIRYNTFTNPSPHIAASLFMPRTLDGFLIEGNRFINGSRAKTEQTHGYPYPSTRNLYLHNTFENMRKGDGEILMYETGGSRWFGTVTGAGIDTLTASGAAWQPTVDGKKPGAKETGMEGSTVIITQGKGVGQFRRIVSSTADTLKLDRPWRVVPGTGSVACIIWGGSIENLHLGNEYFRCSHYTGVYGSGIRTAWVNEIHEDVSGGTTFWPISGPRIMMFNLVYGSKYHERGGVMLQNGRSVPGDMPEGQKEPYRSLQKMVGNEVRGCSIEDRRYKSTENGQVWTNVMRLQWAARGHSSPFTPVPGEEAAIAIWDTLAWANYPEDPGMDPLPASSRWNLFTQNQIVRCPTGVLVGKAVENTVIAGNTFYETPQPVYDLGRGTIQIDNYVHQQPAPK